MTTNGYWDRVLHVDLDRSETHVESLGEAFWRRHLGGRSLIAHYLLREVPRDADLLGPDNVLVFACGILTALPFPRRWARLRRREVTPDWRLWRVRGAGGFWGAELRHAGWDAIVVHGRAAGPVYLWIADDHVEFRDAGHLWGRETGEVEDTIRQSHGDRLVRIAQTGIAGEHGVRFALVVNDLNEVAGRTGLGAVMASKNLKAIAVRGTRKMPVADNTPIQQTSRWVIDTMEDNHTTSITGTRPCWVSI
jgi:aldehyde:ferredoxin oxidoreductase